jgi:hypothetical protein
MESNHLKEERKWYSDVEIREMGEKARVLVDIKDRKCRD